MIRFARCRWWCFVALVAWLAHPTWAVDGFEPCSLRELARQLGVGHGPGYHNNPCLPHLAAEHNRMLTGQRRAQCLDVTRARLARTTPAVTVLPNHAGEYGLPAGRVCLSGPSSPRYDTRNDAPLQPTPDAANSPSAPQANGPDGGPEPAPAGSSEQLPAPADDSQAGTIEELLRGIQRPPTQVPDDALAEPQTEAGYTPGQQLWERLGPETRELFRREFPNHPSIPGNDAPPATSGR